MVIEYRERGAARGPWIKARPVNCDDALGLSDRCPNCNQYHLRPGYCQALDPINAAKYPHLHGQSHGDAESQISETETPESHENETPEADETDAQSHETKPWVKLGISRATYYRQKRTAQQPQQDN